jgi:hypothetical protein
MGEREREGGEEGEREGGEWEERRVDAYLKGVEPFPRECWGFWRLD